MRILHCCLACPFVPDGGYQETRLAKLCRADGCEVYVAASPVTIESGRYVPAPVGFFDTEEGVHVRRLAYIGGIPAALGSKLRIYPAFKGMLEELKPDLIFMHGAQTRELLTAARYKRRHPEVGLLVDCHATVGNSAHEWLASAILHGIYYRAIYNLAYRDIDQLYCVGAEEYAFALKYLRNDESRMKLMPLGDDLLSAEERQAARRELRGRYGLPDDAVVMLHSGKISALKNTLWLLKAMREHDDPRLRLMIIGTVTDPAIEAAVGEAAASDRRIIPLGWMNAAELRRHMCAADIYMQPGTVSSSLQTAMCSGLGCVCRPREIYTSLFGADDGVVFTDSEDDFSDVVGRLCAGTLDASELGRRAWAFARERLDYSAQLRQFVYPYAKGGAKRYE